MAAVLHGPMLAWRPWLRGGGDFCLALTTGLLMGLPFYSERASWLAWCAMLPLAWALTTPRVGLAFYVGAFYGGLGFGLLAFDWMRQAEPQRLFDAWLCLAHLTALFWSLAIWLGRRFVQVSRCSLLVSLPGFWLAAEWLIWQAGRVACDDGFPFVQLGITQVKHTRLIQVADLAGVAAVTSLIALVNAAAFLLAQEAARALQYRQWRLARTLTIAAVPTCLIVAALAYGTWRIEQPSKDRGPHLAGPVVGLVSGPFDGMPGERYQVLQRNLAACVADRSDYPHLLVWKELACNQTYSLGDPPTALDLSLVDLHAPVDVPGAGAQVGSPDRLRQIASQLACSLLVGAKRQDTGISAGAAHEHRFNSLLYVGSANTPVMCYDKAHLAPVMEFRPRFASLMPLPGVDLTRAARFARGRGAPTFDLVANAREYRFATSICYDVFFPEQHRRHVADRQQAVDFFVCGTNERHAQGSSFVRLSYAHQRFRAIECRRPYARNASDGISAIVDCCGVCLPSQSLELNDGPAVSVARLPITQARSLFSRFGDWLSNSAAAMFVLVLAYSFVPQRDRGRIPNKARRST